MLYLLFTTTLLMMAWRRFAGRTVLLTLLAYSVVLANGWALLQQACPDDVPTLLVAHGLLRLDTSTLGAMLALVAMGGVVMHRTQDLGWEFHLLLLGGLTGACYLVTAYDLLLALIGFEFLNLSTYLILSLYRGTETATLKYLLSSAFFTTLFLLAISVYYGLTGSTGYDALFVQMAFLEAPLVPQLLLLATVSFKLALVPAHLWLPDVYDGLPLPLLAWLGTVPKAALLLWLPMVAPLLNAWGPALLCVGVLSFTLASVLLGAQYKLKRFLAYSAIGHVGFLATALALGDAHAYGFYLGVYFLATLAQMVLLAELPRTDRLSDTHVLTTHRPLALGFWVVVLTMAALPPSAGFYAKLLVLVGLLDVGYALFAVFLVLASLRSAAFYLTWLQRTLFTPTPVRAGPALTVAYPNLIAGLVTGLLPSTLLLLL